MKKHIFVTGGVVSGLGKGITVASLGRLLKERGFKVSAQKLDPYINVDPGTMNPLQHGEVFVTDDGAETDLDLGHYERFIDENLNQYSNLTSGKVFFNVINREREGGYLGETVQVIPHITDEIKNFVYKSAEKSDADILITEIGGTIGDIESQPYLEAIRQILIEQGTENCLFIHVALIPYLKSSKEHKSKPAQHSVKELRGAGISPNIIIARADEPVSESIIEKLSLFCNVKKDCVIENLTVDHLYEAPLMLHRKGLDNIVCRELKLEAEEPDLTSWKMMVEKSKNVIKKVKIAIVGKYVELEDAYLSIIESLNHAGNDKNVEVEIKWVDSETVEAINCKEVFEDVKGILIPGGFGSRGIEGKIRACQFARENNIPYFGICLGMQIAIIEFARNVCGLDGATSSEFDQCAKHKVIHIMEEQKNIVEKGGTMRLGSYPCKVRDNSMLSSLYGMNLINERHRHRYEVNNHYRQMFEEKGIVISGTSPDNLLVETIEIRENEFFVGVQFHPEFKSRPNKPHPLFVGFIEASIKEI